MVPAVVTPAVRGVAAVVSLLAVLLAKSASAQDPYLINFAPALTPWRNGTSAVQAGSAIAELNGAAITLGPCVYRQFHYHITADEMYYMIKGEVVSVMVAPNNTIITHNMTVGMAVVYPKGWQHYQINPTCRPAQNFVAFNARSIGTVNSVNNLVALPSAYLDAAFQARAPQSNGLWAIDAKCAKRCKIPA